MKLSYVFPVRNQSEKLLHNLFEKGIPHFDALGITYECLIVYDGSNEAERKIMEEAAKDFPLQVKLIPYEDHSGKGHNVQKGILAATGDYVLFMDADFATSLDTIEKILPDIAKFDCFFASRHCNGAKINAKQTPKRRFVSFCSRCLIKMKFRFKGVHDSQCGYKLFRADLAKAMATRQIVDRFAFDVEYFYFLKLNGFSWKEIPCVWTDDADSTIGHAGRHSRDFMEDMRRIKKNKKNYILSDEEKASLSRGEANAD